MFVIPIEIIPNLINNVILIPFKGTACLATQVLNVVLANLVFN